MCHSHREGQATAELPGVELHLHHLSLLGLGTQNVCEMSVCILREKSLGVWVAVEAPACARPQAASGLGSTGHSTDSELQQVSRKVFSDRHWP